MSLQRILQSLFPNLLKPTDDLSFGLFPALGLPALLRQQRWPELEQLLTAATADDLTLLLDELCLTNRYTAALTAYLQATDSAVGELVRGVYQTHLAWQARSSNWGSELTQQQIDGFIYHLEQAHRSLSREYAPAALQLQALGRRIRVEMGLSELQEAHKTFAAAVSQHPDPLLTYLNYFKLLSPRWLGSAPELQELIAFAEDEDTRQLLRLMFLVEMFSDLQNEVEFSAGRRFRAAHQATIDAALQAPRQPVSGTMKSIYIGNYLACLFSILGMRKEQKAVVQQLGTRFTLFPWGYFGVSGQRQIKALNLG